MIGGRQVRTSTEYKRCSAADRNTESGTGVAREEFRFGDVNDDDE